MKLFRISLALFLIVVGYYVGYVSQKPKIEKLTKEVEQYHERVTVLQSRSSTLARYLQERERVIAEKEDIINKLQHIKDKYKIGRFKITAYSPYDNVDGMQADSTSNRTATGTIPKPGTMAVDPNVIPYGSTIIIIYEDGTVEYGRAEDTGGAINGNRIDVFRKTYKSAKEFGVRHATVIWYK